MGDSEDETKASLSEAIRDIIRKEITAALSSIPGTHIADKAPGHSGKKERLGITCIRSGRECRGACYLPQQQERALRWQARDTTPSPSNQMHGD